MIDLSNFKRPALQFSGGKDSLCLLYLLREQLKDITVYRLSTGDEPPETLAVVDAVKGWIPNFVTVQTDSKSWRQVHGMPSDIVPARNHEIGIAYGMSSLRLSGRFECCSANLMLPVHERMLADGVDCVIRGTKICDTGKVPYEGESPWYMLLLPLRDWSHEQVFAYLKSVGAPHNPIYDLTKGASAPECLSCTAWWDDGKSAYLKARHPKAYQEYRVNVQAILHSVKTCIEDLEEEL